MKQLWRPETGIFLGLWLVLLVLGRSAMLRDPGTFWHTVVGERIFAEGFFDTDPFTFTHQGHEWIPHQWLGECGMALLYRIGKLDALLLAATALLALLYTWLAHRLMRAGLHWMPAALLAGLVAAAGSFHFNVRPYLLSILFLGWTHGRLCDVDAGRASLRSLFWLVPLFVVWTNVHGGMLGGLGTLGLVAIGWALFGLIGWDSPLKSRREVTLMVLLGIACGLTMFVNPYGWRLPEAWRLIMQSPLLPRLVSEHEPLDLLDKDAAMFLALAVIYLGTLLAVRGVRPRASWLLPLVWLVLAFLRKRHAPMFAITAGLAIAEMLPYTRWAQWLAGRGDLYQVPTEEARRRSWSLDPRALVLPGLLIGFALSLQHAEMRVPLVGAGWAKLDPTYWPVEEDGTPMKELLEFERTHPPGTRIFNDYQQGGFLILYAPRLMVFVDDRAEMFTDDFLADVYRTERGEGWRVEEQWGKRYQFDAVLTKTGGSVYQYLSSEGVKSRWRKARELAGGTLFVRLEKPGSPP